MTTPLWGWVMGFVGSMPLAGPIAVIVFSLGVMGRYREGVRVAAGAALAEGIYLGVALTALEGVRAHFPGLDQVLQAITASVFLGLGLFFGLSRPRLEARDVAPELLARSFGLGFATCILNPTLLLTWSAAVAIFQAQWGFTFTLWQGVGFVVGATSGIISWFVVMLLILRWLRGRLPLSFLAGCVRGMGGLLFLLGLRLGWGLGHT